MSETVLTLLRVLSEQGTWTLAPSRKEHGGLIIEFIRTGDHHLLGVMEMSFEDFERDLARAVARFSFVLGKDSVKPAAKQMPMNKKIEQSAEAKI